MGRDRVLYGPPASNELTASPGASGYNYDANGNMTARNGITYNWDFENRLTSVVFPGSGGTVSFAYDPSGRRIQKAFGSSTTNYVYDGDNLIQELDSAGTVLARYTQGLGIDETLADNRGGVVSFYEADGLGSTTSLTNADGAEVARYGYDSFGNLTRGTAIGRANTSIRYTGRQFDAETGLYYYRARYYDPNIGRFITEDPAGFGGGINFYAYAKNDPIDFIDPTGLKCWQSSNWTEIPNVWGPDGPTPYLTMQDGVNWVKTGWTYSGLGIDKTHCVCQWVASHTRIRKFYRVPVKEQAQFTCDCPASTEYRTRERTEKYEIDSPGNEFWPTQYATTSGPTFQGSDTVGSNPANKNNVICGCRVPAP